MKKGGLGKSIKDVGLGIGALIPETAQDDAEKAVRMVRLSQIEPNPGQPRHVFDTEKLEALAESIQQHGLLQPIVVKENENGYYTIIAGERRWRAAKKAGLKEVPVLVRNFDEKTVAQVSLVENLQREDLNPLEEAQGYRKLMDEYGLTQDEVSRVVGKSRTNVANMLRILNLSDEVRRLVELGELSAGHARALLGIADPAQQVEAAMLVIEKELSVRQTEQLVKDWDKKKADKQKPKQNLAALELQENLSHKLGTKVRISEGKQKGKIEIEFYDQDGLNKIVNLLNQ